MLASVDEACAVSIVAASEVVGLVDEAVDDVPNPKDKTNRTTSRKKNPMTKEVDAVVVVVADSVAVGEAFATVDSVVAVAEADSADQDPTTRTKEAKRLTVSKETETVHLVVEGVAAVVEDVGMVVLVAEDVDAEGVVQAKTVDKVNKPFKVRSPIFVTPYFVPSLCISIVLYC